MQDCLYKEGEIGFRFSKEVQEKYIEEFNSTHLISHNTVMKGYVIIPENILKDLDNVIECLDESFDYVMILDPK